MNRMLGLPPARGTRRARGGRRRAPSLHAWPRGLWCRVRGGFGSGRRILRLSLGVALIAAGQARDPEHDARGRNDRGEVLVMNNVLWSLMGSPWTSGAGAQLRRLRAEPAVVVEMRAPSSQSRGEVDSTTRPLVDWRRVILLVEDDEDVREMLKLTLEVARLRGRGRKERHRGARSAGRRRPCLVILDLVMPDDERVGRPRADEGARARRCPGVCDLRAQRAVPRRDRGNALQAVRDQRAPRGHEPILLAPFTRLSARPRSAGAGRRSACDATWCRGRACRGALRRSCATGSDRARYRARAPWS